MPLLRLSGAPLLRLAARAADASLLHSPPRRTRYEPDAGSTGSVTVPG